MEQHNLVAVPSLEASRSNWDTPPKLSCPLPDCIAHSPSPACWSVSGSPTGSWLRNDNQVMENQLDSVVVRKVEKKAVVTYVEVCVDGNRSKRRNWRNIRI